MQMAVTALIATTALAGAAQAQAAPVPWGGTGANDLGPGSILLSAENGRVAVTNVQVVMSCTDLTDGQLTDQAWYASSARRATLRRNRFSMRLTADAGGFNGVARLTGTARIDVDAEARDGDGVTIQRCGARVEFRLRRGPGA